MKNDETTATINHPFISSWKVKLPTKGKLKWLGGNLALAYPVREDVIDENGKYLVMDLGEVLAKIDDFEGYRCNTSIKENLVGNCFIAYEYNLLTQDERLIFESFVRARIGVSTPFEAAKAILLQH